MIYRQPSSPVLKSEASSQINKIVNCKATEEIRENASQKAPSSIDNDESPDVDGNK